MQFEPTENQQAVQRGIAAIVDDFSDDYWLQLDRDGTFPTEFYQAVAAGGWLGIAMPEAYGGSALGIGDAAVMMLTIADSAGGMAAASSVHMNVFGPHPIVVFGTPEQKQRWLPPLIEGREKCCFGITEPDAGLDTTRITTRAERRDDGYALFGRKVWTSTAQQANKVMLLARTTPLDECRQPADGLSLFYATLDRRYVDVRAIDKMGRAAVDSNELAIDGLPVPAQDLIGEEGKGFRYLLHSLNPERILIAAEAIGIGRQALARATRYARERVVFDRPIGQNQAIQHPLATNWIELEAAFLTCMRAAWLYDRGESCGAEANAAKYLGAEAGYNACLQAVTTHGGMGYAKEFHVERLLREVMITKLAPVSAQLILSYVAEKVLALPKSY